MTTKKKTTEPATEPEPVAPPPGLSNALQVTLTGLNDGQSRNEGHCNTIARLYLDKSISEQDRDYLLIYLQAREGEPMEKIRADYQKCEDAYHKELLGDDAE